MARVDPRISHRRFTNIRNVGERGRPQAGPEVECAAFAFEPCVSHAQLITQAADGALDLIVNQTDRRRCFWFEQLERGAVAFSWVNRQIDADRAQQQRTVRAAGHHTGVSGQYQLIFSIIYVASLGLSCLDSYAFYSVVITLKPLCGTALQ